ncbi:MAG: hypothetical protein ACREXS_09155, partial [Gammaproteobacteria bacterium]
MRAIVCRAVLDYLSAVCTRAASVHTQDETAPSMSFLARASRLWQRAPLYMRIVLGLVLGVIVGLALGPAAGGLGLPGQLVLRLLGALAPPLILAAIMHALMTAQLEG